MLRSDFCYYSHAYIVVKGTTDFLAAAENENDKAEKNIVFENNAPFIPKIKNTLIGNTEACERVMSMYNLFEYSQNYSMT